MISNRQAIFGIAAAGNQRADLLAQQRRFGALAELGPAISVFGSARVRSGLIDSQLSPPFVVFHTVFDVKYRIFGSTGENRHLPAPVARKPHPAT